MSRKYNYHDEPLRRTNAEFDDLWRRLGALEAQKVTKLANIQVGTAETEIRHGLGKAPEDVNVIPRSSATVYQTKTPSDTSVFFAASVACKVDVYLR